MILFFKWLFIQIAGSLVMSLSVCYLLIGHVKGFYEPGYAKVGFLYLIFLLFSFLFGLPLLLFWTLLVKSKIFNLFIFISGLALFLILPINLFYLNFEYTITLIFSYFPFYIYFFINSKTRS